MIRIAARIGAVTAVAFLSACGGSGSDLTETDYVQACVKAQGADESLCKCTASEAKAKLSAEGWKIFVLQAQGKTQEASELAMKMPMEERGKMVGATIEVATKCVSAYQK